MTSPLVVLTDRSRTLTYQRCNRARWLEYEYRGLGIRANALNVDQWTGICVHVGVNGLIEGKSEDESVGLGLEKYWPEVKKYGLWVEDNIDASYVANEQAAMVEALVRLYSRYCLPRIKERFWIVEAEREDITTLVHGEDTLCHCGDYFKDHGYSSNHYPVELMLGSPEILWQSRADALFLEKDTLDLYIHSLKTAKTWGQKDDDSARCDMQGLSEIWAVDNRLKKWATKHNINEEIPEWFIKRAAEGAAPHVAGIKMEFLLKGYKDRTPPYGYGSPLIRPWKDTRDDLGRANWAWKWDWKDELGNKHTLGNKYRKVNIWEGMGVKSWMDMLGAGVVQPGAGDPFESQVVLPIEYFRNDYDSKRWLRQTQFRERRIAQASETANQLLASGKLQEFEEVLDEHFEQDTRSCVWPSKCQFKEVCFGPEGMLFNPESGPYRAREPHHAEELKRIEKRRRRD